MAKNSYKRLARHPGIWRVDGVGSIQENGKLGARTTVYFSGIKEEEINEPYRSPALNGETLSLKVHVASLRDFQPGTLWRDGKCILGAADHTKIEYEIDASNVRIVTLEASTKLSNIWTNSVIPEFQFKMGENRTHLSKTLYALVPVIANKSTQWLVIPCSELLRFYAGISSRFLASALQGSWGNYINWNKSRYVDGRPIIHLKQRINRKEAAILARAVANHDAKEALLGIHKHLSVLTSNNSTQTDGNKKPLVIKAAFPFKDATKLFVAGKKIRIAKAPHGGADQWGVFVMEILHCSHPFGFSSVVYETDDPYETRGHGNGGDGVKPPQEYPLIEEEEEDEWELDDVPADAKLIRLATRNYTNQFGGLDFMSFEHWHPNVTPGNSAAPGAHIPVDVNALTLEDGTHAEDGNGNLGVSEFQNRIEQVDRELSEFLEMLKYLRKTIAPWTITTRKFGDGVTKEGESIALFPEKMGKRRTWHKISEPNGNIRPRQVVLAEVSLGNNQYFYLLEMELKPTENGQCTILLHTNRFSRLEETPFLKLLRLTAIQNRWPDKHNKWKEASHAKEAKEFFEFFQMHRINHPPVPRTKSKNKTEASVQKISPKNWSKALVEKFDEILFELRAAGK